MELHTVKYLKEQVEIARIRRRKLAADPMWVFEKDCLADALAQLKDTYGIKSNISPCGLLVSLKYDQLESPKAHKIVRECRGLVLDAQTLAPVCIQFNRFFNYGESEDSVNLDNMVVVEKHDGSLMSLYYHLDEWHCCTSGTPTGECNVGDWDLTFKDLFWQAFKSKIENLDKRKTYTFELIAPHNKIVRSYNEPDIVLLGVRYEGVEQDDKHCDMIAHANGFTRPKVFDLKDIDSIIDSWKILKPQEEGYVAVDYTRRDEFGNYTRCKIKNPAYVALHRLKDSSCNSRRALLEVVLTGEIDEIITYFPEYTDTLREFETKLNNLIVDHDAFTKEALDNSWPPQQIGPRAGHAKLNTSWVFAIVNGKAKDTKDAIRQGIKAKGLKCFAKSLLKGW